MNDEHDLEIQFLRNLCHMTYDELKIQLYFQCCEQWRKIAVEREMGRRLLGTRIKSIHLRYMHLWCNGSHAGLRSQCREA